MTDSLATQVLDLVASVTDGLGAAAPVRFEELSADPGELPRFMLSLSETGEAEQRYISGERLMPFPFALTLRLAGDDEQSRLDAQETLNEAAEGILARCAVLDGWVAYTRPLASPAVCLGKANGFEDWQITFDLKYKQAR